MRNRRAFLSLSLMAVGLLAATAMAADPVPQKSCTTPNGWPVSTEGLIYDSVSNTTAITYHVGAGPSSTPDHVGTFVRFEAGPVTAYGSASVSSLCFGESVLGIGDNAVCHERIVRFNNQQAKASDFKLGVTGRRKPITTSVVVKKGNSQGACQIIGIGLEDTTAAGNCVHQCGDFSANQAVRTVETFKFKGCEVAFDFNPMTGEVTNFYLVSQAPDATCTLSQGPVGDLFVSGGPLGGNNDVTFGDGWISSGNDSCATRLIAGRYCTVCY